MRRLPTRHRDYLVAGILVVAGILLASIPGRIGTDQPSGVFVSLGASLAVGGIAWGLLRLDRQVSDDPRYQPPTATEDDED
jgi:drug/metabolite transporter (DMT)-like permease